MEVGPYFFDTYALYSIANGTHSYAPYKRVPCVTSVLNLMELHYCLLKDHGKETANRYFDRFRSYAWDTNDDTIKQAMEFKLENKKRNLSYVDCVGYLMAQRNGLVFLTGDKEFKDIQGVEYVK
jgi:predicted nucleic acid-binding protein